MPVGPEKLSRMRVKDGESGGKLMKLLWAEGLGWAHQALIKLGIQDAVLVFL